MSPTRAKADAAGATGKKKTAPTRKTPASDTVKVTTPRARSKRKPEVEAQPLPDELLEVSGSGATQDETICDEPSPGDFAAFDENLLDVSRTRWQFGEWPRLATISAESLFHHPDRARIALFVASAHFQLDNAQQGYRLLQLALDWGSSRRQAIQILISGTHHSLAEACQILGRSEPAHAHYRQAIRTGGIPGDVELLAEARESRSRKPNH